MAGNSACVDPPAARKLSANRSDALGLHLDLTFVTFLTKHLLLEFLNSVFCFTKNTLIRTILKSYLSVRLKTNYKKLSWISDTGSILSRANLYLFNPY